MDVRNETTMNQTSFVSIQEDGSTCLKHLVGYASPKLTPKHTRSVKQSKRKTKSQESPRLEFPPPPSFPPPEHYDLSDEYSAELIDGNVFNCKISQRHLHRHNNNNNNRHHHHGHNNHRNRSNGEEENEDGRFVRGEEIGNDILFRSAEDDQPPEGFWNSPIEAPWSYFLGGNKTNIVGREGGGQLVNEKGIYGVRDPKNEVQKNAKAGSEFWDDRAQPVENDWARKDVNSSTPYLERKPRIKKSVLSNGDEADAASEEIMLINKLKEDMSGEEQQTGPNITQDFRSEIWVSAAIPVREKNDGTNVADKTADSESPCIQIKNNHISNVLITHGNEEILDNFIEDKPISHKDTRNGVQESKYEMHLVNAPYDAGATPCQKCAPSEGGKGTYSARDDKTVAVVLGDYTRQDHHRANKIRCSYGGPVVNPLLPMAYPDEYSYAYYEPGPATRVPSCQEGRKYGHGRNSRYTYTTRYGTEENIYEEITEVSCNLKDCFYDEKGLKRYDRALGKPSDYHRPHTLMGHGKTYGGRLYGSHCLGKEQSQLSLSQSIVEEEVREVQSTHKRVLGQLNLTMEEMLMPNSLKEKEEESKEEAEADPKKLDFLDGNQITDLDSGFSGSSGTSASFYGGSNYAGRSAFRKPEPHSSRSFHASSNSKIYPQMHFKSKHYGDVRDYRRHCSGSGCRVHGGGDGGGSGGSAGKEVECCGECCCAQKYQYHCSGSLMPGDNSMMMMMEYSPSPCYASAYSCSRSFPNFQRKSLGSSTCSMDGPGRKSLAASMKSLSFPRGMAASGSFSKKSSSSGSGSSWAKRGWKKLTGLAIGSTNKVNVLDEPHAKASGWEHGHAHGRASSEDSWCSGSDNELSSGDESSERSATSSTRSNGQLRQTLNKARTLCDKLRPHALKDPPPGHDGGQPPGRLSRWFSMRRGSSNQYELDNGQDRLHIGGKMPLLSEADEEMLAQSNGTPGTMPTSSAFSRRQVPPTLPPPPPNLTPQQLKRRHIIAAIVHSENSYVATLQRLVNDYKKPLEESSPTILSSSKISTLFLRLPEILQCHTLFRIALAEAIRTWDKDERIGDVFVASFSKSIVLDVYSGFINNFSIAMDLAKTEAKRKSALADFLKVKQISSHDRLSFFGLMVKPVQRFPQFILFLQDLLKHTPQGHHDRMSLQLALTQLESLAEMLNERKRESEQFQAFKEMLRHVSGKFARPSLSDSDRYLLREDNVTQLEFNQNGVVTKSKNRRLLLLNDLLVCVSVAPKSADDFSSSERLTLKWSHPVTDVEIQDTSASPTLSRLLTAGLNRSGSLKKESNPDGAAHQPVDTICQEMADLMHDYEVLSRITEWVGTLKGRYKELTVDSMKNLLHDIQVEIQKKDEVMSWVDSCCLQITLKSKNKEETVTFQTDNPSVKKEWITELRLAQLALDVNNSPAWEIPEEEQRPSTKMPLFVKAQSVYSSKHQTEVKCGCFYTVATNKASTSHRRARHQNYLWVCTSDGVSSHISILAQQSHQASQLKNVQAFDLVETRITCMEFVKGVDGPGLEGDLVWMGTDSCKVIVYNANEPEKEEEVTTFTVPAAAIQIRYHSNNVFIASANGNLLIYQRNDTGSWPNSPNTSISLGSDPVSCLLPINSSLYAACGKKVYVHCIYTGEIQRSFSVLHDQVGNVNLMAHSGVGLWISLKNSSTICLYHTETFKHLQDINIASNVLRVTSPPSGQCSNRECATNSRSLISVTSLMACKGLLWVGTNVGIALTIPLPRLEGVPIISGRVNISYHAHFGAISFLLALQPKSYVCTGKKSPEEKKTSSASEKSKQQLLASPVMLRKKKISKEGEGGRRMSKTLPRGIFSSSSSSQSSNEACDVYGLYGELMNCKDFENEEASNTDPIYESLRRSDPDLSTLPGKISTLDRRLKMKASRPRSLDLSNWSVESHTSSVYTSSGSEECVQKQKTDLNRTNSNNEGKMTGKGKDLKRSESTGALPNVTFDQEIVVRRRKSGQMSKGDRGEEEGVGAGEEGELVTDGKAEGSANKKAETDTSDKGREVKVERCKTLNKCKTMKGTAADCGRRTIITLMGGRGYVNWRQTCCNSDKQKTTTVKDPDSNDAHIVIWEMKL